MTKEETQETHEEGIKHLNRKTIFLTSSQTLFASKLQVILNLN